MNQENIKIIYEQLKGYLSQTPTEGGVTLGMVNQVNQAIDELNSVSGENYDRFKMDSEVEPDDEPMYSAFDIVEFRFTLSGLILRLYGEYFSNEPPPFSGPQSPVIIQTQEQNPTQEQNQMHMKSKAVHFLVNMILKATNKEILLVSLIVFIPLLTFFTTLLDRFHSLDQHSDWKLIIICVFSALYVLAIIILICGRIREKKFSTARDLVQIYLKEKLKRMSFDRVREKIDEYYTDCFLEKLIKKYPKVFRRCQIKPNRKPGITLTRDESQDT